MCLGELGLFVHELIPAWMRVSSDGMNDAGGCNLAFCNNTDGCSCRDAQNNTTDNDAILRSVEGAARVEEIIRSRDVW